MTEQNSEAGTPDSRLVGVVLAGGKSSRLGRDKAALRLDGGGDLLARTVALLRELCGAAIVAGRADPAYFCLPDEEPGLGPAGGIVSALKHVRGPCLVLSCDLPFMDLPTLRKLVKHRALRPRSALCTAYSDGDGRMEALVAIYEYAALPFFQDSILARGLKMRRILPLARLHLLPYQAGEALPFFNVNRPEDLDEARRIIGANQQS